MCSKLKPFNAKIVRWPYICSTWEIIGVTESSVRWWETCTKVLQSRSNALETGSGDGHPWVTGNNKGYLWYHKETIKPTRKLRIYSLGIPGHTYHLVCVMISTFNFTSSYGTSMIKIILLNIAQRDACINKETYGTQLTIPYVEHIFSY